MRAIMKGLGLSLIVIFAFVLMGAGGMKFNLNKYQEECYEYKVIYYNQTLCKYLLYTMNYTGNDYSFGYINLSKDGVLDKRQISRICYGGTYTITLSNVTDECIKYHLVRKP